MCWVECAIQYPFPFFTSTISVGRGCLLIAQRKTECCESYLSNEPTLLQRSYSVEPAIMAYEERDFAGK